MAVPGTSSSSGQPDILLGCYLYDENNNRVAYVGVPTNPQPPLLLWNGGYFVWSIQSLRYKKTTPQVVSATAQPPMSVVANPQF